MFPPAESQVIFLSKETPIVSVDLRTAEVSFSTGLHFQNGRHNTAKIQHCSISKVAFDLFFKPVVIGQFGRLHNH